MGFRDGDLVLLVGEKRRFIIVLKAGENFHFQNGFVAHDAVIGQAEGARVLSSLGFELTALKPTLADYIAKIKRRTQIIHPKDVGAILLWADIYPGALVVESGIGSGALTVAMLRAVGPNGRVVSIELREEFAHQARDNVARYFGECPWHEIRLGNIYDGTDITQADRFILDVPEPWKGLPAAAAALRLGGIVVAHTPTTIQGQQFRAELPQRGFGLAETFEVLVRPWEMTGLSVRPAHRMVAHTAFIHIARKIG